MRRNGSAVPGDGGLREKLSGHSENCEPLPIRGPGRTRPQGKMVRKEPPADASDSEGQKRATGARREEDVLHQCILNPENHGRIASSSIMSALDVLIRHDLILPEETYEVTLPMGKGNPDEACRFLRSLCESPGRATKNPALEAWSLLRIICTPLGPLFDAVDPARYWPAFDACEPRRRFAQRSSCATNAYKFWLGVCYRPLFHFSVPLSV
ncbi:hypothetical protein Q5P01_000081 [Channa striata]|uniref:Uncharacterized protein n=1 Tax=Channa striata TaxID=64152 RepID=A0AA88IFW9_CHASR|nr:hypothetical protein Q5P01_000081 [Channa striata]